MTKILCDTPVLIVGGGPCGLAVAADLGWRGIPCTLIEQSSEKMGAAKMILVSVRSMEYVRRLGFREKVVDWGFPPDRSLDNVFVTSLNGYEIGRIPMPTMGEYRGSRYSPEMQAYCPQTWFDPIVKDAAREYPHVTLRYRTRLEAFEQDEEGVHALVTDGETGERGLIRCQYMVAADGYNSTVRRHLGIAMRGRPLLDHSVNVELIIRDLHALHDKGDAGRYILVGPEGTWATFISVDGRDLWRITLYGANQIDVRNIDIDAAIKRCIGRDDVEYEITDIGEWVRRAVIADRLSDGRVFIVGDAGHTHPPNGGLGMNTGLGDSADIAWKLAAVLDGWGGDRLLDSYDLERRPACHRAMNESLSNYDRLVGNTVFDDVDKATSAGDRIRNILGERLVGENTKAWRPLGIHLGMTYDPSPLIVPDGTPMPEDDTIGYIPTARPGSRAPHAWLPDGRSILDLFGRRYTLLRFPKHGSSVVADSWPLERAMKAQGVPLDVHDVSDLNSADLYEAPMVLVRPDGHVAWRGSHIPGQPAGLVDRIRGARPPIAACVGSKLRQQAQMRAENPQTVPKTVPQPASLAAE